MSMSDRVKELAKEMICDLRERGIPVPEDERHNIESWLQRAIDSDRRTAQAKAHADWIDSYV